FFNGIGQRRLGGEQLESQQYLQGCQPGSGSCDAKRWRVSTHTQIVTGANKSSTLPLLSAKESRWTPTLSSSVRWRFASGTGFAYLMWRVAFIPVAEPPATRIGRFV